MRMCWGAWENYVVYGGMPLAVLKQDEKERAAYLAGLFEKLYVADIVERYGVEDAFIFENARRYDVKGRRYFDSPMKYYATDVGLRNARLNFRQIEQTHLMENVLYNELVLRGYSVDVGKRVYIQSAFSVADDAKRR